MIFAELFHRHERSKSARDEPQRGALFAAGRGSVAVYLWPSALDSSLALRAVGCEGHPAASAAVLLGRVAAIRGVAVAFSIWLGCAAACTCDAVQHLASGMLHGVYSMFNGLCAFRTSRLQAWQGLQQRIGACCTCKGLRSGWFWAR